MYYYISGKVRSVNPTSVLVDNRGIGYLIHISLQTYAKIKEMQEVQLFTHCIIKNESQASSLFAIYGFADEQEKGIFMDLISVSGVGNNTAQLILSSFDPSDLIQAIASGNVAALQKVKGIGNKTAQRIIVDLKDKILKTSGDLKIQAPAGNSNREESLSALLTLGFNKTAAEKAVDKAMKDSGTDTTVEHVIKTALGYLSS